MIKVFFYVYQVKNWKQIYDETINLILKYLKYDELYLLFSHYIINEDRLKCIAISNNGKNDYEFFPLSTIQKAVNSDDKVLYCHTKGVVNSNKYTTSWRHYMQHFLIKNYKQCLIKLDTCDAVGVELTRNVDNINYIMLKNIIDKEIYFYAGNFWWANGNYLLKLPKLENMNMKYRWGAERWIGLNKESKLCSLYHTNKDLYKNEAMKYVEL